MKLEEAITKRILDLCNERGIAPNGLPSSTIRCIFYGRSKNPGTRTILDICQALEISIYDFFNDEVFKSKELEGSY